MDEEKCKKIKSQFFDCYPSIEKITGGKYPTKQYNNINDIRYTYSHRKNKENKTKQFFFENIKDCKAAQIYASHHFHQLYRFAYSLFISKSFILIFLAPQKKSF